MSFIKSSLILMSCSIVWTKTMGQSSDCYDLNRVDAITSLKNGTVFLASDQYYWFLNNKSLDTFGNTSKGLISELIPGMRSLKLAVSIRYSISANSTEELFFHTFEDNQYKSMAYKNRMWIDGHSYLRDFLAITFKINFNDSQLNGTKVVVLYGRDLGNPTLLISLNSSAETYYIKYQENVWTRTLVERLVLDNITDKPFLDSLYVKNPDDFNLSYTVFSGNQYFNCKIIGQYVAQEECDSNKRNISDLIPCLPTFPLNTVAEQYNEGGTGINQTLIWILIGVLVIAFILLIVVLIVYCKCVNVVDTKDSDFERSKEKIEKEVKESEEPKAEETPNLANADPDPIGSEQLSKTRSKSAAGHKDPDPEPRTERSKVSMGETIKRMNEILSKRGNKEKEKKALLPSDDTKEQKERKRSKGRKKSPKEKRMDKREETAEKGTSNMQKNVKELKTLLSDKGSKKEPILESNVVSKAGNEDKVRATETTEPVSAVSRLTETQSNDERVRRLLASNVSQISPDSSQAENKRIDKLLKD